MTEYYEIRFKYATVGGPGNIIGILELLQLLGDLGASRKIGVIEEEGWEWFLFDGDGPDKIKKIKIKRISERKYVKG